MNNNFFPISKEGWKYVGVTFGAFLLLGVLDLDFLQFFSFLAVLFFLYVFRNPERQIPAVENGGITSPVDGTVNAINELENTIEITIQSSYNDVSVLRAPIGSSVKNICEEKGASLSSKSTKSKLLNEKLILTFEDAQQRQLRVSHLSVLNFSEISYDLISSQKLIQGSRYGVMPKGITTIEVPKTSKINLRIGSQVKACESIIAYFS